jgi:hypothetical protein
MSEGSIFFEDRGSVQATLRRICSRLDELGIPYAVAGGMALYLHGYRRFTEDVDILVTREGLKQIHDNLDGRGFVRPFEKSKNLRDAETKVKIEFLITGQFPGDGKPKPVAFPDPATVSIVHQGIRVVGLPTLVTLKLACWMTTPTRAKDYADVQELVKTLNLTQEFADELDPYVRAAYLQIFGAQQANPTSYELLWRNKWLTANCRSLEEMISTLRAAADELEVMKEKGVVLDPESGIGDDYATLVTTDPSVAQKFQMMDRAELYLDDDESPAE